MDYFWSPNKGFTYGAKEEKRKREIKLRYRFLHRFMTLVWNCKDFGMIFVHELLGYDYSLKIKLVPFSRVLLGRHPNSRFKGSLVENP